MLTLNITIEEKMLEHIFGITRHQKKHETHLWCCSQKERYETATSRKRAVINFTTDKTIAQYFQRVKSICQKITKLDPKFVTGEA